MGVRLAYGSSLDYWQPKAGQDDIIEGEFYVVEPVSGELPSPTKDATISDSPPQQS